MVTVYVWEWRWKTRSVGHAALQVGSTYISWWPEKDKPEWYRPIYASAPYRTRTLAQDAWEEERSPDHTIRIDGLNEAAIHSWWRSFGLIRDGVALPGPLQQWHTTKQSCATVAARALRIGGGDEYAKWVHTWNTVWTPADVADYARSIRRGMFAKGRNPAVSMSR